MSRLLRTLVLALGLVLMPSLLLAQDLKIDVAALKGGGINPQTLQIGDLSRDGTVLLCSEKATDPKLKAKGQVFRLVVFQLDFPKKSFTARAVWLPQTDVQQLALSEDGKQILVFGDAGTTFTVVDMATLKPKTFYKGSRGKPGFRSYPPVVWLEKGKFHTVGYFYEADQTVTREAVVAIDPEKGGLEAFTEVRDIAKLNRAVENYRLGQWYSSEQAYFAGYLPDKSTTLYSVGSDGILKVLDKAKAFEGIAVAQDRVIYAARQDPSTLRVYLQDLAYNKKWTIGDGRRPLKYLYLSDDGSVLLTSEIDYSNGRITTWWASENDNFSLKPVPSLQGVKAGSIRFSGNGRVIAFINEDGLLFLGIAP